MEVPGSSFDSYEQDFNQLINAMHEKLDSDKTNEPAVGRYLSQDLLEMAFLYCYPSEQRNATFRRVEMELDEADEMV
jgi:vesicle transport through interaction with t-SNAREs 1